MFPGSDNHVGEGYIFNIFEHLREQLTHRGPKGFFMLYRSLKHNDFDADGRLSCKEFIKSLHEIRVELLDKETINIFKVFDANNSGFIMISEFMSSFVPELNPRRDSIIKDILNSLEGVSQKITYSKIKKVFNARGHPDFTSGSKADYDIRDSFFFILDTFLNLSGGVNDFIPRNLMLQFFEIFSYAYQDDSYFENIIRGIFRMNKYNQAFDKNSLEDFDNQSVSSYQTHQSKMSNSSQVFPPYGIDDQAAPVRPKSNYSTTSQPNEKVKEGSIAKSLIYQDAVPSPEMTPPRQNNFIKKNSAAKDTAKGSNPNPPPFIQNHQIDDVPSYDSYSDRGSPFDKPEYSVRTGQTGRDSVSRRHEVNLKPENRAISFESAKNEIFTKIQKIPKGFLEIERQFVTIDTNKTRQ